MKRTLHILAIAALLCGLGAAQAMAQPADLINARLALHTTAHGTKSSCAFNQNPTIAGVPCESYTTSWPAFSGADVWYVVAHNGGAGAGPGFTGVTAGIEYDPAVGQFGWTKCATLEFPNAGPNGPWPNSGGGNVITWEACEGTTIAPNGAHAVAGFFYMYAYGEGTMSATENRNLAAGSDFELANCGGQSLSLWSYHDPSVLPLLFGTVHFGGDGSLGYTPCGVVATEKTTWGNIKTLYGESE